MVDIKKITDIVWLNTGFLGDLVLNSAAIQLVHDHYPQIRQTLVTTEIGAKVYENHPGLTEVIIFKKQSNWLFNFLSGSKSIRQALAKHKKKSKRLNVVTLQAHRSFRSSFVALLLPYPRITFFESALSRWSHRRVPRVAVLHEAYRIGLLLEPLGIKRELILNAKVKLNPEQLPENLVNRFNNDPKKQLVAVAPGSVWATKRWPSESYGKLIVEILQNPTVSVVLLGSPDEREICLKVMTYLKSKIGEGVSQRVFDLSGQTSIKDMKAVFPRLKLLIANDSAPIHFASAYNVPTVAIFGATVPAMGFAPLADSSSSVDIALSCRPCGAHGPMTCPLGHFKCMLELDVSKVVSRALPLLQQHAAQ